MQQIKRGGIQEGEDIFLFYFRNGRMLRTTSFVALLIILHENRPSVDLIDELIAAFIAASRVTDFTALKAKPMTPAAQSAPR